MSDPRGRDARGRADDRVARRLRSAFGDLFAILVAEAPERAAWTDLGFDEVEGAIARARERVGEPGHALGFRTLLKQELDALCELTPPVMPFESSALPADRTVRQRALRADERQRERERRDELRRDELRAQAAELLRAQLERER